MKNMNLHELVALVRAEKPSTSVGAIRYHIREMNLGRSNDDGYRFFDESDVAAVIDRLGAVGRPKGTVAERRVAKLPEMSGVRQAAFALDMTYYMLSFMVRECMVPSIKIGSRYYFTKEMVSWIMSHPKGAINSWHRQWVVDHSGTYNDVEEWRLRGKKYVDNPTHLG